MSELKPLVIGDLVEVKNQSSREEWGRHQPAQAGRCRGKAGGMGIISAAQIGFRGAGFHHQFRGSKLKVHPAGDETGQRNRTLGRDWFQHHGGYQAL